MSRPQGVLWHPKRLFIGGVAGALYLPRPETCRVMSDGSGSPAVVGDPIGWLMDESGNGNHATQATTANKPILRQTAAGRWYLDATGAKFMTLSQLSLFRNVPYAMIMMALDNISTAAGTRNYFAATRGGGSTIRVGLRASAADMDTGGRRLDSDNFQTIAAASATVRHVATGVLSYTNAQARLYRNLALVASSNAFQTAGNTEDTDSLGIGLFALHAGTSPTDCHGYGTLLTAFALSDANRERAIRYLATLAGVAL